MPGWRDYYESTTGGSTAPDAQLVEVFRSMRQDARSDPQPAELAQSFSINIGFDGAGLLPTIGMVQILDLGQLRARITGAVIVANGVGAATIDLRLGTFTDAAAGVPLTRIYGATGSIPTLTASAGVVLNTTTWTLNLQPTDVLVATLLTVTSVIASPGVGALTSLTLSIHCRRLKWPAGGSQLTDNIGDNLTTAGGQTVQLRA